ncbi:MAG: helix-turn-helix domain-containing protein [Bacteroidetes bacterium]|nr:helix-turn-helix domain-containing protein [Bacteroidota bacterium]
MQNNEKRIIDLSVQELQELIEKTIKNSSPASQSVPEEQDIISIEMVMKITRLARQTIYQHVHYGAIPFIKRPNSRKLYFSKSAIIAWLKTGR